MSSVRESGRVCEKGRGRRGGGRVGREIDVSEPCGAADDVVFGGMVKDWKSIDSEPMRRKMTYALLIAVLTLVLAGLLAGVIGVAPAIIGALAILIAKPLYMVYRYYFYV